MSNVVSSNTNWSMIHIVTSVHFSGNKYFFLFNTSNRHIFIHWLAFFCLSYCDFPLFLLLCLYFMFSALVVWGGRDAVSVVGDHEWMSPCELCLPSSPCNCLTFEITYWLFLLPSLDVFPVLLYGFSIPRAHSRGPWGHLTIFMKLGLFCLAYHSYT